MNSTVKRAGSKLTHNPGEVPYYQCQKNPQCSAQARNYAQELMY